MNYKKCTVIWGVIFTFAMFYSSVTLSNDYLNNSNAYFYVTKNLCAPCNVASIESLSKQMKKNGLKNSYIVGDQLSKSLMRFYRKIEGIDSVFISSNPLPSFYNQSPDKAKLIIRDTALNIQYEFPDISNLKLINKILVSEMKPHEYTIPYDEKAEYVNVFSPYIDYDNKKLMFISPEYTSILSYDYSKGTFEGTITPSKEDKFYFLDTTKESKEFWELTYSYYKQFIHPYFIYRSNDVYKLWISTFSGYKFDSLVKMSIWKVSPAIYSLQKSNKNKDHIKKIDKDTQLQAYGRISSELNDSLLILKAVNDKMHEYYTAFNKNKEEMLQGNLDELTLNNVDSVGSLFATYHNILCIYNRTSNLLLAYEYNPTNNKFVVITKKENFLPLKNLIDVKDIFIDSNLLYVVYFNNENNYSLMRVFSTNDYNWIMSFPIPVNEQYKDLYIPLDINKNRYSQLTSNDDGDLLLETFELK